MNKKNINQKRKEIKDKINQEGLQVLTEAEAHARMDRGYQDVILLIDKQTGERAFCIESPDNHVDGFAIRNADGTTTIL